MHVQRKKQGGQGMTEYLIIVALMAISAIAIIRTTSNSMKVGFGKIANALQGKQETTAFEEVNESDTKGKNLGDFNSGVRGNGN